VETRESVRMESEQLDRIERMLELILDQLKIIEREVVWASEDDDYEDDDEDMRDNRPTKKQKFI
jgi:hypothetical protein